MRQGINDMFHEQMKTVDSITQNIKQTSVPGEVLRTEHENEKIKLEHMLEKKINSVEYLGKILLQQEKEFVMILKQ